jgi:hypothetical protein
MPPLTENSEDTNSARHSTSAMGQIAQAVADLFKKIVEGIPPGRPGLICRFLIIIEVLLTVFGMGAIVAHMHDIVWGCLICMVAFSVALLFIYGTPNDNNLSAGQQARVQQILGTE